MTCRLLAVLLALITTARLGAGVPLDVEDLNLSGVAQADFQFDLTRLAPTSADLHLGAVPRSLLPALDLEALPAHAADLRLAALAPTSWDLWLAGLPASAVALDLAGLGARSADLDLRGTALSAVGLDLTARGPVAFDLGLASVGVARFGLDLRLLVLEGPDLQLKAVPADPFDLEL
ncbi:MAG: hypothetical protein HYY25_09015 [Candidatus Wallbacteria bacterium]|nr:hypothetical protein [Candidatus Wallbacteria bacterium]